MVTPVVSAAWNPQMYANEALRYLTHRTGFIRTVNSTYHNERQSFRKGNTISVRKRQAATIRDETDLSFDTLDPGSLEITLDKYRHGSFETDDYNLTFAGAALLEEQIFPTVDALAQAVDLVCLQGARDAVGAYHLMDSTPDVADLAAAQRVLFENKCPVQDEANMHLVMSPTLQEALVALQAFSQFQGAGPAGVQTQMSGQIARRYGFNLMPTALVPTWTDNTLSTDTLAVNGTFAVGAESINLDAVSVTGNITPGTIFTIAGDTTKYCVTNTVTASGNAFASVGISPGLQVAPDNDAVVTVVDGSTIDGKQNLAYHRDAFAFVAAPLPRAAQHMAAAQVGVAADAETGLALRVAFGWDLATRKNQGVIDVLFGFKVLNPFLACRLIEA